jgi:DNA-directed RNA polymerase specialized sigma24 family protein
VLATAEQVVRCLLTYTDWWQPSTTSVLEVAGARRNKDLTDGFRSGLLETLDDRTELRHRVAELRAADRQLLFLWYVEQLPVEAIARAAGVSRRQCFRRRAAAVREIVRLGDPAQPR